MKRTYGVFYQSVIITASSHYVITPQIANECEFLPAERERRKLVSAAKLKKKINKFYNNHQRKDCIKY